MILDISHLSTPAQSRSDQPSSPRLHSLGSFEGLGDEDYLTWTNEAEFSFGDLIDIVNPLQHLPIVGSVYRKVTGDDISAPSRIIGGSIFGGPAGLVMALVNALTEEISGRDLGQTVIALFENEESPVPADDSLSQAAAEVPGTAEGNTVPPAQALPTSASNDLPAGQPLQGESGAGRLSHRSWSGCGYDAAGGWWCRRARRTKRRAKEFPPPPGSEFLRSCRPG